MSFINCSCMKSHFVNYAKNCLIKLKISVFFFLMFKLGNSCLSSKRKTQVNRESKERLVPWEDWWPEKPEFWYPAPGKGSGNHLLLLGPQGTTVVQCHVLASGGCCEGRGSILSFARFSEAMREDSLQFCTQTCGNDSGFIKLLRGDQCELEAGGMGLDLEVAEGRNKNIDRTATRG